MYQRKKMFGKIVRIRRSTQFSVIRFGPFRSLFRGSKRWKGGKFKTPSGFRDSRRSISVLPGNALSGKSWSNTRVVGALKVRNLVARQTLMPTHCRDDLMPCRCVFSPCKNRISYGSAHVLRSILVPGARISLSVPWFCRARIVLPRAILDSYHRIETVFRIRATVYKIYLRIEWFRIIFFSSSKITESDLLIHERRIFNRIPSR